MRLQTQNLPRATPSREKSSSPGVDRVGQPHREHGGRLALQRQVGEHVAHQRLVDEQGPERAAVPGVVHGPHQGGAHRRGRAEHAVEPGRGDHADDGADAAPLVTDPHRPGAVELDLGRRVRPVAELVLQALQPDLVAGAVVEHPGEQEAADAGVGLRQDEEGVAHRRRAEPLVPGEAVRVAGERATRGGDRPGRVGPHVGAALLLGHPHADGQPGLVGHRRQHRVVGARGEARHPARGHVGLGRERGRGGIRHRDRAEVAGLDLRPHHEPGGPAGVGAAVGGAGPGLGGQAVAHRDLHQAVVGRVELDLVDPLAGGGVGAQHRCDPVGLVGPLPHLGGAGERAQVVERGRPTRVGRGDPPVDGLGEGRVGAQQVEPAGGRDDVGDDVGPHPCRVRRLRLAP